eukprot:TRINITY_DN15224_c0_g1_i3.p1 TRINITY_DN15224_c0_g1~~TRINITY_DN15224_c0_g1_i3.p1  ORF type:complete len:271 (+),score=48.91 TRINITY_DN15224_c0_g1_i3:91-903(+)
MCIRDRYSSFSASDQKFLAELEGSFSAGRSRAGGLGVVGETCFVWPTVEEVRGCIEGYWAGASMPSAQKNVVKVPPEMLRSWGSDRTDCAGMVAARRVVMPHIKSVVRLSRDGNEIAWMCLTSANLSKAAWGCLQKKDSQLFCRHWEVGVLFTPKTLARQPSFSCSAACVPPVVAAPQEEHDDQACVLVPPGCAAESSGGSTHRTVMIPLPYQVPPSRYSQAERGPWQLGLEEWACEPWHSDGDWPSRRDKFGRTNCYDCSVYGVTEDTR